MSAQMKLNLGGTPQILSLTGGMFGAQQLVLTFGTNPSSGTVSIAVLPVGGTQWIALAKATNIPVNAGPYFIRSTGWISQVRVTFNGVVGGDSAWIWAEQIDMPAGLFLGSAAMTVQGYVEANVKNGVQFSASTYLTGLTAGELIDTIVITGSKKVLIKGQYIGLKDGGDVLLEWYKSPAYTGGSNLSSGIYNQSDVNPVATTVQLFGVAPTNPSTGDYTPNDATKVTVSNPGTKKLPTLVALGISGQGSGQNSNAATEGLEHLLDANSVYLFRRRAVAATASMFGFSTWFEGEPDFPL